MDTTKFTHRSNNLLQHISKGKGPCDRLRDTGTPYGRKRKIAELSLYGTFTS